MKFTYLISTWSCRYRTALKEIKTLRELNRLQWKGVPKLYGYCITPTEIVYAVSQIVGRPLCRGMGISMSCAIARDLAEHIETTPDPGLSTLTFLSKVRIIKNWLLTKHSFWLQTLKEPVFALIKLFMNFYWHFCKFFVCDLNKRIYMQIRIWA